jgi:protein gp37
MSETTTISWTDATWNPWRGCDKVSPGCAHCYMFRDQQRYGRNPSIVLRAADATFRAPLKWKEPRFIFTCSWSDWFHESADPWRDEAWEIVRQTPQHTYQILTKRPERMQERLPWSAFGDPWPNVWLGVSVENQRFAHRARILSGIPAAVRFISAEPLLGDLSLALGGINWVIVGGESGPDYREMNLDWLAGVVQQCRNADVPVWVKQDSGKLPGKRGRIPDDLWVQERPAPRLALSGEEETR